MNATLFGLPAIALWVGFLVVLAAPVWLAARVVGAARPTLLRSIAALLLGLVGATVSAATAGAVALVLAPLSFLLSFRFVLGTSFLGAIALALLAAAAYAAMVHFIGGGITFSGDSIRAGAPAYRVTPARPPTDRAAGVRAAAARPSSTAG